MLQVLFLIALSAAYGDEMESSKVFNKASGHFFANNDKTIPPNESWTAIIEPPNATDIFVVIEDMILDENDTMSLISDDKTLKVMSGSQDPFSFLVNGPNLTIVVNTSANRNAARKFVGYYTNTGCIYQLNSTFGTLSTPTLYTKNGISNCSFSIIPQFKLFSKVSVTFLHFQFNKSVLKIIHDENIDNYTGDSIPSEIIADKKLELIFTLNGNDTAKFAHETVLKESEYIELNNSQSSYNFAYKPSPVEGYYPSGEECHWVIKSEENTTISFKFIDISLPSTATRIIFNDGKNKFSNLLFHVSSIDQKVAKKRYIASSGKFLWISIEQPDKNTLVFGEATMRRNGGYRKGSGKLSVPSNSTDVIYLLEEEIGKNIVLSQHKGSLTINSTISVYNDFSTDSLPILSYNMSLPHYAIVSSTSKMMVIATNFGENSSYEANFKGVNEGCDKMSVLKNGEYLLSGNCNTTCNWIVPPVKDINSVISLHIHPYEFEEQDVVTLSLLDVAQTQITNITSHTVVLPEFYLPSSSGFLLNTTRGNCSVANDMLHATFEKKKGCNSIQKLAPGNHLSVSSPNFPDSYPLWAHCWYNISTINDSKNNHFLLTVKRIDLAKTHYLRIIDSIGNSTKIVQTYKGTLDVLPEDLILSNRASIEFSAQPCNSTKKQPLNLSTTSGFSLDIIAADCGDKITKKEGNFTTPDYPKNTSALFCIWILEVPDNHSIINFTLTKNDSKDYELNIYDGPSVRNETMKNHSSSTHLSLTNSLIFVYHRSNNSQTAQGIQVAFHSQECSKRCENGLCLHEDWICNGINNCGDNTDEINCGFVPYTTTSPPPPETKSYGVSPVALGLGIPIAFILGIVATIYLPPLIRRFRSGQYHQFRDVSADA
uniref:Cubilin n=1 Tax=Hadrurus spadix TaxID=141984 RepID=A0A1W7RAP5_9SCOR